MPVIDFSLNVDQYETRWAYRLEPAQYEMAPKIDAELRTVKCALGLWNLADKHGGEEDQYAE